MYGMIHKAAREFTIHEFGEDQWKTIMAASGLSDEHFISGQVFPDELTNKLIGEMVSASGLTPASVLEKFGRYWIIFTSANSYSTVLGMAGEEMVEFLENLDNMHTSIKATMPEAEMPSFQVSHSSPSRIDIIYRSKREGLAPFVKGLLEGILDRFSEAGHVSYNQTNDGIKFVIERECAASAA